MKKITGLILALGLILANLAGVAAQDAGSTFANDITTPVVWADSSGNRIASLTVTDIDTNFQDYESTGDLDYGYTYQAVQFTVENVSEDAIIIEPSRFNLLDDHGRMHSRTTLQSTNSGLEFLSGQFALAPGEIVDGALAFQTPAHVSAAMLIWEPDSDQRLMVNLGAESTETGAVVFGLNTPSVFTDDFGNAVASIEVTGINDNWTDYSDFDEPEDGETYMAVHITMVNLTDRTVEFKPYDFRMIDDSGASMSTSYARAHDDAEVPAFRDPIEVAPGETAEAMLIYEFVEDQRPVALQWQITWRASNMVILVGGDEAATPDVEGTPAAD